MSTSTRSISTCDMSFPKRVKKKGSWGTSTFGTQKTYVPCRTHISKILFWCSQIFKLLQLEYLTEPNNILDTSSLNILEPINDFLPEPPNRTIPWTVPALAQAATLHAHQATVWNPFLGLMVNQILRMHIWVIKKYLGDQTHYFHRPNKLDELHMPTGVAIMARLKGKNSAFRCKRWWLYTKYGKSKIQTKTEVEIIPTKTETLHPNKGIHMGFFGKTSFSPRPHQIPHWFWFYLTCVVPKKGKHRYKHPKRNEFSVHVTCIRVPQNMIPATLKKVFSHPCKQKNTIHRTYNLLSEHS